MKAEGVAVVTGASRGLGRAVAVELAERGFDVIATMRDPAVADLPDGITVQRLDVTDPGDFAFPSDLSVLVNNAGVRREYLPVEHVPVEEWRSVFETNVFAVAELCKRAIPLLRDRGGGVICNVSSTSVVLPLPFFAVYRASKAAVSAMNDTLRVELAPFGIRVVEIMPGPIETDLLADSVMMRPPEAIEYPDYEPMARRSITGGDQSVVITTPAPKAAAAIADAILADDGPLRFGCDPVSVAQIRQWRESSDEDFFATMRQRFID